jgi:glycogen(starch) synthase
MTALTAPLAAPVVVHQPGAHPDARPPLDVLALGMSWFPEQAGNGLDRVYHALSEHLPATGVHLRGLVAGTAAAERSSQGRVRAFADDTASLTARLLGARRAIRRAFADAPPDLVAAHFALYAAPALDLLGRAPLVVHFHGPWAAESAVEGASPTVVRAKHAMERAVYRRAARYVVLSEAFERLLVASYGVEAGRVRIVPGGVDAERFDTGLTRAEARRRLGWSPDRPIVLAVRRLARRMGLEGLLDALRVIRCQVPDVLLLIAGRGPLEDELAARIRELGLQQHARLLGFVPEENLPLAYRAADLSIVPTVALEGFGLTTVESLAAGTPVLVTPEGGLPEVVRDLAPALICAGSDAASLADRLTAALRGTCPLPDEDACRAFARERHDWTAVARRVRAVYDEVAG